MACIQNGPSLSNCFLVVGPNYAFGEAPMMLIVKMHTIGAAVEDGECIDVVVPG